jgi:hypothetical protein
MPTTNIPPYNYVSQDELTKPAQGEKQGANPTALNPIPHRRGADAWITSRRLGKLAPANPER